MIFSTLATKASKVATLQSPTTIPTKIAPSCADSSKLSQCTLQWRQNQLWVTRSTSAQLLPLPSLQNQALLTNCLKQSAVNLVVLDPALGTDATQIWLDTCAAANKRAVVRVPSASKKGSKGDRLLRLLKQVPDQLLSVTVLAMLSPFVLGIRFLLQVTTVLTSPRWQRALSGLR